ncbi:hypothetical protein [Dapis sp. BLCC M229]
MKPNLSLGSIQNIILVEVGLPLRKASYVISTQPTDIWYFWGGDAIARY